MERITRVELAYAAWETYSPYVLQNSHMIKMTYFQRFIQIINSANFNSHPLFLTVFKPFSVPIVFHFR